MRTRLWTLVVVCALCLPLPASADLPSRLLRRITIDDGLSQNSVYCLHQDSCGFLWFGTGDGLNRYDGYAITIYRHDPDDTTSIPQNAVRVIAESRDGTLFFGTDKGVARYNRREGEFETLWPQAAYRLLVSKSGILWIGTDGSGLVALNLSTGRPLLFDSEQHGRRAIRGSTIRGLAEAPDGTLWIASDSALQWIRPGEDSVCSIPAQPFSTAAMANVRDLAIDRNGRLWLGTLGVGLLWYSPATGTAGQLRAGTKDSRSLPSDSIFSVGTDQAGNLWIGTFRGPAFCTDPEFGRFNALPGAYGTPVRVAFDRSGLIWVGTDGFGVEVHTLRPKRFQLLRANPGDPHSLSGDFVRSIFEDGKGEVWIGTFSHGITIWNRNQDSFRHVNSRNSRLRGMDVRAIAEDAQGSLWIGTDDGLNEYVRLKGEFRFHPAPAVPAMLSANERLTQINGIAHDTDERLWIATNSGLEIFDCREKRFLPGNDGLQFLQRVPRVHINSIYLDGDSLAWLGTRYVGLLRIDRRSGEVRTFEHVASDSTSVNSRTVRSAFRDSRGRLWVATDHGLGRMTDSTGRFERILPRDGLPSASLYGILEDRGGNLWISSNGGLARFSPDTRAIRSYGRRDGLQSNEFNAGAFFSNHVGEMYFGGVYGLNHFNPDSLRDNPTLPPVVLTGFKKFDIPTPLGVDPPEVREVALNADETVFSLQYAALEYTDPSANQYAYRLEGFETAWIKAGTRREVRYTSLPPGEYLFRVKAANSDGIWNERGLSVRIVIIPPFWRSWWFILLCVFTLIGGGFGTIRYVELKRIREKIARLEKEEAVQRERVRISRDMHDELGAHLTRISLLAGIAGSPGRKEEEVRGFLEKIGQASRDVVQHFDEVVWLVNPKNDTLESLSAYVAEYAEQFFAESPIRCRFDFPTVVPPSPLPAELRRNVFLVVQESLNNILKHSDAGVATLELHLEGGTARFIVRDNGNGFDPSGTGPLGNGISNMKKRIDEIGGVYSLASEPGKGTTIEVSFPLPPG